MDKGIIVVLAFGFVSMLFAHIAFSSPITSDAFESMRVAELLKNESFPVQSANFDASNTIYPPLFSFILLSISVLLSVNYFHAFVFLSFVFTILISLTTYLLVRFLSNDKLQAILASLLIFAIPWLFYRLVTPIAETLGLFLFILVFYTFAKNKLRFTTILLVIAPLAHFRSFAVLLLALFFYSVLNRKFPQFIKSSLPGALLFLSLVPFSSVGFQNPLVIESSVVQVLSPLIIILSAIGVLLSLHKFGRTNSMAMSVVGSFVITFLLVPFPFRQFIYLFVPGILFSSLAAKSNKIFSIIVLFLIVFSVSSIIDYRSSPFDSEELAAFATLKSFEGERVIADFSHNYGVASVSKKKVLLGAFAEELPDGEERINDLQLFFSDEAVQQKIARKHSIDLIFTPSDTKIYSETRLFASNNLAIYAS